MAKMTVKTKTVDGVTTVSNPKERYTLAFQQAAPRANKPRMTQVAVAWCSPEDEFSRSTGKTIAVYNLEHEMCINVPLANLSIGSQAQVLQSMFDGAELTTELFPE